MIAGVQITVSDVYDHRFLERPLMAFLIEAHLQRLHRRGALPRHERCRVIFRADEVGAAWIAGLEQRPVGVKLEGRFQPRAICNARRANLIVEHDLVPASRFEMRDIATHAPRKRQPLVTFI